jgi:competence protein ComEC
MKKPLGVLVIFYGLGIFLASLIQVSLWIIMAMVIAVFTAMLLKAENEKLFLVSIIFLAMLAGCWNLNNSHKLSRCHLRNRVLYLDDTIYSVSGFVASVPEDRGRYTWFILRAREVQIDKLKYNCCGDLLAKLDFNQALNYGQNLTLTGNLSRVQGFNRLNHSYQDFLKRQGIYLTISIQDTRQIIRHGGFGGVKLDQACFWLRGYLERVIGRYLPGLPASILSAMVLGQKRDIPWLVNDMMVKSGTVHILVVSGFNVGIVAFIVNLLLKVARFPRKLRIILTAACLLTYCLMTGATNPVMRATIMGLVFLAAHLLKREPDIYNSLASAALFILAINPQQLFDIGFQLSFISVLAIVYLYPRLKAWTHLENCQFKILRFTAEGFLVSFSAWLGTLAIIASNFRIISLVTVLANILIVPLATLITLCGFTLVLSGLICPGLASILSLPTAALITLLLAINTALVKLPFAYIYF